MDKKITHLQIKETKEKSLTMLLQSSSSLTIKSRGDCCCEEQEGVNDRICASDLFSFFTANVIKEEVVFTR